MLGPSIRQAGRAGRGRAEARLPLLGQDHRRGYNYPHGLRGLLVPAPVLRAAGRCAGWLEEACLQGEAGEVGAAPASGLVPDPVQVGANGTDADVQLGGYLGVGTAPIRAAPRPTHCAPLPPLRLPTPPLPGGSAPDQHVYGTFRGQIAGSDAGAGSRAAKDQGVLQARFGALLTGFPAHCWCALTPGWIEYARRIAPGSAWRA